MADSRAGAEIVRNDPGTSYAIMFASGTNTNGEISKEKSDQVEGVPSGQIWGNWSIKINNCDGSLLSWNT